MFNLGIENFIVAEAKIFKGAELSIQVKLIEHKKLTKKANKANYRTIKNRKFKNIRGNQLTINMKISKKMIIKQRVFKVKNRHFKKNK